MEPQCPPSHSSILCSGPLGLSDGQLCASQPPAPSGMLLGFIQTPPMQSTLCSPATVQCQCVMMENDAPSMTLLLRCSHAWHSSPALGHYTNGLSSLEFPSLCAHVPHGTAAGCLTKIPCTSPLHNHRFLKLLATLVHCWFHFLYTRCVCVWGGHLCAYNMLTCVCNMFSCVCTIFSLMCVI